MIRRYPNRYPKKYPQMWLCPDIRIRGIRIRRIRIWLQQLAISADALLKYADASSPTYEIGVLGFSCWRISVLYTRMFYFLSTLIITRSFLPYISTSCPFDHLYSLAVVTRIPQSFLPSLCPTEVCIYLTISDTITYAPSQLLLISFFY